MVKLPEYENNDWVAAPVVTLKLRMLTAQGTTKQFKLSHLRPELDAEDVKAIANVLISHRHVYKYKPIKLSGASINVKISRYVPIEI